MTSLEPLVVVEHVTRQYSSAAGTVTALNDVSFAIAPGELVALVGRSGSGKTTLLNCVGGLDRPTSGRILIEGKDATAMDENARTQLRRDELAFVFQTFGLVPMLSAAENVWPADAAPQDSRRRARGTSCSPPGPGRPRGIRGAASVRALRRPAATGRDRTRARQLAETADRRRNRQGSWTPTREPRIMALLQSVVRTEGATGDHLHARTPACRPSPTTHFGSLTGVLTTFGTARRPGTLSRQPT